MSVEEIKKIGTDLDGLVAFANERGFDFSKQDLKMAGALENRQSVDYYGGSGC